MKYYYIYPYMLKPPNLLLQGFKKKAQDKLFKHMCKFGEREEWSNGGRDVSSYIDVDTRKDQFHLLNPTPLDCIPG